MPADTSASPAPVPETASPPSEGGAKPRRKKGEAAPKAATGSGKKQGKGKGKTTAKRGRRGEGAKPPGGKKTQLSSKQRKFITEYAACLNGTEAARRAGYGGSDNTLAAIAYENLRKPHIAAAVKELMEAQAMPAHETIARLSEQARASMGDFFDIDEDGQPALNLKKAEERGKLGLIRSLRFDRDGNLRSFEVCDIQGALVHIGRTQGLFKDSLDVTTKGEAMTPRLDVTIALFQEVQEELAQWRRERFGSV